MTTRRNTTMKITLISIIAILSVILAGCAESETSSATDPFVGGNVAVTKDFIANAPPDTIFDGGEYPFTVSLRLENKGEYDIQEGEGFLQIQGISPAEFGATDANLRIPFPELRGVRKATDASIRRGDVQVATFPELNYRDELGGDLPLNNFRVRSCYEYETKSSTQICVKEGNVDGLRPDEICNIDEMKRTANSGAPLRVQNLEQSPRGRTGIQVSFEIAHVGPVRNTWFPSGDSSCDPRVGNPDLHRINVEVEPIVSGRYSAQCSGGTFSGSNRGEITLHDGKPARVVCSFELGEQTSDFETRLNINLNYRYSEYIEKPILIRNTLRN